jgi:diguanylate cyclase (GGDEF)-like protein
MNGTLLSWTERITRLPVAIRVAGVLLALVTVIVIDLITGPDLTLNFLNSMCVIAASWFISRRWGLITAGLASLAALLVNVVYEFEFRWPIVLANNALRSVSFVFFAVLTAAVRRNVIDLIDTTRIDEMTGVLSRRGFLDELAAARRRAAQRTAPLGVVYLDLDGLKSVNDSEGHAAGDALIKQFVDGVARHLRSTDVFGRLGGDEFAIVLERADPLVIDGVVGRIVSDSRVPQVSTGVRVFEGPYPSPTEMLARADRRMYQDKQRRRSEGSPSRS